MTISPLLVAGDDALDLARRVALAAVTDRVGERLLERELDLA